MSAGGFAVIYRWRVAPEREAQFVKAWVRVTKAMRQGCGSYGSRLHKSSDGLWVAYARWPDAETRNHCSHDDKQAEDMMTEAITEVLPTIYLDLTHDLLAEPDQSGKVPPT